MINETESINQLIQKLIEIGYSESDLQANTSTKYDRGVDLVVYEASKPKIVFEIKTSSNTASLLESLNEEQMRYHSSVRQVQSLAKDMGAPYFAIYDGKTIFWFGIDEDGRPKQFPNPIPAYSTGESRDESLRLAHTLYRITDMGFAKFPFMRDELYFCVGASVLAWALNKQGEHTLREQLLSTELNLDVVKEYLPDSGGLTRHYSKEFFSEALSLLDQIGFSKDQSKEFIKTLDEYLEFNFTNKRTEAIRLPAWISEFMASLSLIRDSDIVLDLNSMFDEIVIASHNINHEARLYSYTANRLSYIWAKTKRVLLDISSNQGDVYLGVSAFQLKQSTNLRVEEPTIVFVTPPFGVKVPSDKPGVTRRSEEIYLEAAVERVKQGGTIVALVPDVFLVSRSFQKIRENIMSSTQVQAIFSLSQYLPNAGIKTSILVLRKKTPLQNENIVFASVQESDIETKVKQAKTIQEGSRLWKIIEFYKTYQQDSVSAIKPENVYLIQEKELTPSSWSITQFVLQEKNVEPSAFPLVRLEEVADVIVGPKQKSRKTKGNTSVSNSSNVRGNVSSNDRIESHEDDFPVNQVEVFQKGDVIVGAIGAYRGRAVPVEELLEGTATSRETLVVKPLQNMVLSRYLLIALNSKSVQRQLEEFSTGTAIKRIRINTLRSLLLPLPSLDVQKQIIDKANVLIENMASLQTRIGELQLANSELRKQFETVIDDFEPSGESNE